MFMFLVPELGQYLHDNALEKVQDALIEYSEIAPYWFVSMFDTINYHKQLGYRIVPPVA